MLKYLSDLSPCPRILLELIACNAYIRSVAFFPLGVGDVWGGWMRSATCFWIATWTATNSGWGSACGCDVTFDLGLNLLYHHWGSNLSKKDILSQFYDMKDKFTLTFELADEFVKPTISAQICRKNNALL